MLLAAQSTAFVLLTLAAAVSDVRSRRIPNSLTVSGFAIALLLRAPLGWDGVLQGLEGAGLAFAVALLLMAVGALGGGDAKLLIAIAAFMGPGRFFGALLAIGVVGGVVGVANAVRQGVILPVLMNSLNMMKFGLTLGRRGYTRSLESPGAVTIPYGVPIAIGSLIWWFVGVPVL